MKGLLNTAQTSDGVLVTRLRLVTHGPRGSASQPAGRAGKAERSQAGLGTRCPSSSVVAHATSTHWPDLALARTASQTFWGSNASRNVGEAG